MRLSDSGAVWRRDGRVFAAAHRWVRRCAVALVFPVLALALGVTAPAPAQAAKRVAPVYPGAVPAVVGKRADGAADPCEGRCFLTKDPIGKVKAFYEKKLGALKATPQPYGQQSYGVMLEYANRSEAGAEWSDVEMFSLAPPPSAPKNAAQRQMAFQKGALGWDAVSGPIHTLVYATDWNNEPNPMTPYKPADLAKLYEKYKHLQSYFYVRNAVTDATRADELGHQFDTSLDQVMKDSMMGNVSTQMAISQAANREGDKIAAEDVQDDPEFDRIMKRKPALARKYSALGQKAQQQAMAGQQEEAMRTLDKADKLLRTDPEMAALMRRYDEREKRRDAVSAKARAQSQAAQSQGFDALAKNRWALAVKTLDAMAKEGYRTYFVVDFALEGKGVERDRAKLARKYTEPSNAPRELDLQARAYELAAKEVGVRLSGMTPEQVAAARGGASSAVAGAAAKKPAQQKATAQKKQEEENSVQEAAKKGLKLLKKLW